MKKYTINGNEYNVSINSYSGSQAELVVNGITYKVKIEDTEYFAVKPVVTTSIVSETSITVQSDLSELSTNAEPAFSGSAKSINSPLPGVVLSVKVKVGDVVKPGHVLAVLDAMKMENEIQCEFTGTVISVNVNPGDSIMQGAPIVTIG